MYSPAVKVNEIVALLKLGKLAAVPPNVTVELKAIFVIFACEYSDVVNSIFNKLADVDVFPERVCETGVFVKPESIKGFVAVKLLSLMLNSIKADSLLFVILLIDSFALETFKETVPDKTQDNE